MSAHPDPNPLVSIILVNYNAADLLAESVGAALASSVPVEVIISDNGSRDKSLDQVRARYGADPRLKILENGANLGFAAANNRALPLARAEYLLLLNPDCLIATDTLACLLPLFDAWPQAGLIGCLVRDPDGREQVACRRAIPDPGKALRHLLGLDRLLGLPGQTLDQRHQPLPDGPVAVEAISGAFMLIRRRVLETVGPLDEGYFLHCEDLDWFVRIRQAGWSILFASQVAVIHHKGSCSNAQPLAVEYHKHRGMLRFFRTHQAHRYPAALRALVTAGIWAHLALKAGQIAWRRLKSQSTRGSRYPCYERPIERASVPVNGSASGQDTP
ncbi:glycosyltransferase family 2 protein [Caldichromatium japonicum]|uniref:Glycosyltransferase family 2 protein n=1 Tax=Caldichromatium japonicum TaxID=2699430 RepID=A0A6G7VG76_9GAMM|nr:glycosyltransferase family 2 protein [Caldichromatium japonicum]QIK38848.1 glycosyltransferase family 2 protein [Caldichromatium japonicum]